MPRTSRPRHASYYDDNFGHWHIEDDSDIDFYHQVARESVRKKCQQCGRTVKLRPDYAICNSCADAQERGWEY
jgi:hypothetical protein